MKKEYRISFALIAPLYANTIVSICPINAPNYVTYAWFLHQGRTDGGQITNQGHTRWQGMIDSFWSRGGGLRRFEITHYPQINEDPPIN